MKKTILVKIITLSMIVTSLVTLTACGEKDKEVTTTTTSPVATEIISEVVEVTDASGEVITDENGEAETEVVTEVITKEKEKVTKKTSGSTASSSDATTKKEETATTAAVKETTTQKEEKTTKKAATSSTTKKTTTTTKKTTTTTTKPTTTTTTQSAYIPTYEDALWIKEQAIAYGKSIGLTHDTTLDQTCDWVSYSGAILEYGADKTTELQSLKQRIKSYTANGGRTAFNVVIYTAGEWNGYPVYVIDPCFGG